MSAHSSSSMSSSSLVPAPLPELWADVSGFATTKHDGFVRVSGVDWDHGIAQKVAGAVEAEFLQERWNTHRAEILPIAAQLCTYGRLSAASACLQAICVHEVIHDRTCLGKALDDKLPTFDHLRPLLPCRMDYSPTTGNAYVELHRTVRLGETIRVQAPASYTTEKLTDVILSLRVSNSGTELLANKRIFCRNDDRQIRAKREIEALRALKGVPHVIQLINARKVTTDTITMVDLWTELATGRHIDWSRIQSLPPAQRWHLYSNFLEALAAVHEQRRIHGNVCIENIWTTHGHNLQGQPVLDIRLGGFGHTKQMLSDKARRGWYCRSKYAAPDVYTTDGHHRVVPAHLDLQGWQKVEVWAAACVGFKAFGGLTLKALHRKLPEKKAFAKTIPEPIETVLRGMLDENPATRLTAQQAFEAIRAQFPLLV